MAEAPLPAVNEPPVEAVPAPAPGVQSLTKLAYAAAIVVALYFAKDVLLPVTLAVLLGFVLSPLVRVLRRIHIPKLAAVIFSVSLALAIIGGIGILVGAQMVEVAQDLPMYQQTIEKKIGAVREATVGRIAEVTSRFQGAIVKPNGPTANPGTPNSSQNPAQEQQRPTPVEVHQPPPDPLSLARTVLLPVLSPLATIAIIFVVAVFILMQQEDLRDRMIRLFGTRDMHRTTVAMDDAAGRLGRYFLVQITINVTFGVIVTGGLYLIGLPQPLLWGIIGALLRFVPYIGSYIAAGIPILLAAAVDPGWSAVLWVAGLFVVTEPIMGQVVEPLAYGRSTGLSPISVVIAAIFWTWIWGPVGLILSTPLTLCLVVLGRHVPQLEFLNVLLGDKPALTRAENFYQRLLANDLDELQEQAEDTLKSLPLVAYYDDVVMKGLELAARDVARGSMSHQQLVKTKDAVVSLVMELGEHDAHQQRQHADKNEAATTAGGTVAPADPVLYASKPGALVCTIAARSQLDEPAAIMLAQILQKRGFKAEFVNRSSVSRGAIAEFDHDAANILCVCHVDALGTTSQLRFLLRRLRQRVPKAKLIVLIWPPDHPLLTERALKNNLGADQYLSSLGSALEACVKITREDQEEAAAETSPNHTSAAAAG